MDLGEKFVIRSNSLDPKQGNILISEPLMNDFHFGRSVILLIDHEEAEGSFGVIINKTLNASVNQIVDDFSATSSPNLAPSLRACIGAERWKHSKP